jgi:NADH dehydrogenase FAD-containing subunit
MDPEAGTPIAPARPMATMQATTLPRIVVLGGEFGGLESVFYLRKRIGRRADLTLVSDRDEFLFKPNTIYIPFGKEPERFVFKLPPALDRRHIHFVQARAENVNPAKKSVVTSRGELPYDYLVVATGATMRPDEIPGLQDHANTIWTPSEMMRLRQSLERVLESARQGHMQRIAFVVPPNNKCSGPLYEIVMMLDTWLRRKKAREACSITYATYEASFIQAFGPRLDGVVVDEFKTRGITGLKEKVVVSVEPSQARFADGSALPFDLLISFPPYIAATRFTGLPSDERGFLRTNLDTRQVEGHPDVYAVGDAGDFPVKQAFLALLQADTAGEHIAQRILGEQPDARFDPVSMCIMEQFDKATFAQVPLELTGDPARPVRVRDEPELYKVGSGEIWRVGKKMLGAALPGRFRHGQPFHAGASWAAMEAGLKMMSSLFAD